LQALLDWLANLPVGALYAIVGIAAFVENVVPPFPSDVVIAFGSFLAAHRHSGLPTVFLVTWIGNVGGAMVVYGLGRKYGADRLERRIAGDRAKSLEAKLSALVERFGLLGIFVSRFLPGVRAILPAFAGALRLPFWRTSAMMALASGIWYLMICYAAYSVGADWDRLRLVLQRYGTTLGVVAVIVAVLALVWANAQQRKESN
jgi:membrane protein DedA with SNARE-associated domain